MFSGYRAGGRWQLCKWVVGSAAAASPQVPPDVYLKSSLWKLYYVYFTTKMHGSPPDIKTLKNYTPGDVYPKNTSVIYLKFNIQIYLK